MFVITYKKSHNLSLLLFVRINKRTAPITILTNDVRLTDAAIIDEVPFYRLENQHEWVGGINSADSLTM